VLALYDLAGYDGAFGELLAELTETP